MYKLDSLRIPKDVDGISHADDLVVGLDICGCCETDEGCDSRNVVLLVSRA